MDRSVVLLVEDDPRELELALHAFEERGISGEVDEVVVVRDGQEALEYLFGEGDHAGRRDPAEMPEFVLMDVHLPKLTGLEVLERIRADERTRLLPVILFSSSGENRDVRRAYETGANSYVTKPMNFGRFSEAIDSVGWYWLEWNENP